MINKLCKEAQKARENAYSPYSRFCVGAALLCNDGSVYTGCNIENASFSATICAERVAVSKAVSEGKREFSAIAIAGAEKGGTLSKPCYPCGVCRQVLSEFCKEDFKVYIVTENRVFEYTLLQLLPNSFEFKEEEKL